MELKIKNKTILGIEKLMNEAAQKEAIPDYIALSLDEAKDFMNEVGNYSHSDIKVTNNNSHCDSTFRVLRNNTLPAAEREEILKEWFKDILIVNWRGIRLRIIEKHTYDKEE